MIGLPHVGKGHRHPFMFGPGAATCLVMGAVLEPGMFGHYALPDHIPYNFAGDGHVSVFHVSSYSNLDDVSTYYIHADVFSHLTFCQRLPELPVEPPIQEQQPAYLPGPRRLSS